MLFAKTSSVFHIDSRKHIAFYLDKDIDSCSIQQQNLQKKSSNVLVTLQEHFDIFSFSIKVYVFSWHADFMILIHNLKKIKHE